MYHQVVSEESVKHIVHNGEWERVDAAGKSADDKMAIR